MARLIRPPRLFVGERLEAERHATWLELFFDLVFVVAVAELAHMLHDDLTWTGVAVFALLFVPVWWQWIDWSYYADQFDTGDVPFVVTMLAAMFAVVVLALTLHDALGEGSATFASVYIALRVLLIGLYVRAWRAVPEARELTGRYILSFVIALAVWIGSLLVEPPARWWLWALALVIEIGNGPVTYATIKRVPAQVSHMDERFGLFAIIVLGESIVAVASGVADTDWAWRAVWTAFMGFVGAACAWWIYFQRAESTIITRAVRGTARDRLLSYVYGYGHLFVFAGIAAGGVGVQVAIESATANEPIPLIGRVALCGGSGLFLVAMSVIDWAAPHEVPRRVLGTRVAVGLFAVVVIVIGGVLPALVLTTLLIGVFVVLTAWETLQTNAAQHQIEREEQIQAQHG